MSVMDRFLNAMKFNDEEEDDDDGFYDSGSDDEFTDKAPSRRPSLSNERKTINDDEKDSSDTESTINKRSSQKVTPIKQQSRRNSSSSGSGAVVLSIMPKTYEDSKIITDTLLENKAVILNLEGLDFDLAQRIIDFSSGSCYALGGNLQWISKYILIIAPQNINITGDFQNLMDGGSGLDI